MLDWTVTIRGLPAIGFTAICHCENGELVAIFAIANTIVSDSQSPFRRFDVFKLFDVSFVEKNKPCNGDKNPLRGFLVDGAEIALCRFFPIDALAHEWLTTSRAGLFS